METMANGSKMSLAASKAWITRRKNLAAGSSSLKNEENKKGKTNKASEKQAVKAESKVAGEVLKAIDAKEMKELNGVELEQLARETQKRLDRKEKMQEAKDGKKIGRASIIGAVIKKAKVERFNGGCKVSGVA